MVVGYGNTQPTALGGCKGSAAQFTLCQDKARNLDVGVGPTNLHAVVRHGTETVTRNGAAPVRAA